MRKVIDMEGVKRADALVAEALRCNPRALDRLTKEDIAMAYEDEKTVLVTIRVPRALLEQFDALVRERAYRKEARITRNSALTDLIRAEISRLEKTTTEEHD